MIVLDLADVGVSRGTGTLDLVRRLRSAHPQLELTAGGGVRGIDDLRQLADAGCDAALVASALHDGRITPDEVRWLQDNC
jgi:phosphoribosylformimino-5-aminoimidazole carboxamide ribotide isomerase